MKNIFFGALLSLIYVIYTPCLAANDGVLGNTSTASSKITLKVQNQVQITNVSDIDLGTYSGFGDLAGKTNFCVYRSHNAGYNITLSSKYEKFQLHSMTTSAKIPFTASVGNNRAVHAKALRQTVAKMKGHNKKRMQGCVQGKKTSMSVKFSEADLQAAPDADDYQAVISLTVEPI